jgi:hypothetical protein
MQHRWEAVLERRQRVAALYLKGLQQGEIAALVGVTQQQVSHDLRRLRESWQQASLQDTAEATARILAENALLKAEAWQAWGQSQKPKETMEIEHSEGGEVLDAQGMPHPKAPTRKAKLRREGSAGDPRFLDRVAQCLDREVELRGLTLARRFRLDFEALSDDQILRLAAGEPPERVLQQMAET